MEGAFWEDDRLFLEWTEADREEIERRVASQRKRYIADMVRRLPIDDPPAPLHGIAHCANTESAVQ